MAGLLFGVETEYAIAGAAPRRAIVREEILQGLMERARDQLIQLPDLHSPGGIYLDNGSRFYVDCGSHPEICTPECANPGMLCAIFRPATAYLPALLPLMCLRPGLEVRSWFSAATWTTAAPTRPGDAMRVTCTGSLKTHCNQRLFRTW